MLQSTHYEQVLWNIMRLIVQLDIVTADEWEDWCLRNWDVDTNICEDLINQQILSEYMIKRVTVTYKTSA